MIVNGTKAITKIETILSSNFIPEDAVKAFEQCIHIIESCDIDECGDNVTVRLENGYEVSPHVFEEIETVDNAVVHIERCIECGKEEIWWERK